MKLSYNLYCLVLTVYVAFIVCTGWGGKITRPGNTELWVLPLRSWRCSLWTRVTRRMIWLYLKSGRQSSSRPEIALLTFCLTMLCLTDSLLSTLFLLKIETPCLLILANIYLIAAGMLTGFFFTWLDNVMNNIFTSLLFPKIGKEMHYYTFSVCPKF